MSVGVTTTGNTEGAPEGGWGYLIVLGLSFVLLATMSYMSCLGILFSEFLEDLGHHTKALTMLPSVFFICFSTTGLFTKYLFNRFSVRSVAIFGGIVFCSGSMMIPFVRSLEELLIAYSLMQGIGFGLAMPAMYTTFIQYFVKRRVMMMALAGALQGIGGVSLPLFMEMLMREYGFRGCMTILGAINLHVLFGVIVLHPVKWHQIKVARRHRTVPMVEESVPLFETPIPLIAKKSVWMEIVDFLDLTLFLNPVYINLCLGVAITIAADISFVTIQSSYLRSISFTSDETAQVLSIGVAADLSSRLILTAVSSPLKVKARPLFLSGAIATIVLLLAFVYVKSYTAVALITAALGFFRAWTHVPVSLVFADLLPARRFPSGYGLYVFVQGICMFAIGPFIGWVRDYTQSFVVTFELLMLAIITCVVSWSIEMLVTHCRKERSRTVSIEDIQHNDVVDVRSSHSA